MCFNSKQLIGNCLVIPSGPLRESFNSILRANCILINGDKNLEFENKIKKTFKKEIKIFYSKYKIKNMENLQNKEIIAFAGIGNPSNFFDLLKENNLNLKKTYSFPDHHFYSQKDFDKIIDVNVKGLYMGLTFLRLSSPLGYQSPYPAASNRGAGTPFSIIYRTTVPPLAADSSQLLL